MAQPSPKPSDWQIANAQELQVTDREVLAMLRAAKKRVDAILAELPAGKQEVRRAQLESTRARLLAEQASVFERLGDIVSARRARAASRSAGLSAAADRALLDLVGKGAEGQFLYDSALQVGQRQIDAALARMRHSQLPLSKRIYNTSVWMGGRLGRLINETLATGLNAKEFARRARDWFNPNTPGGVRYAAMRLARTEINNAFHAMTAEKAARDPWITEVEWNLSKSHPKPDICNTVHAESPFPADKVPARPHPQCMCYITPKAIDEDEFVDNFLKGDYDDFLDAELAANGWEPEEPAPSTHSKSAGTQSQTPEQRVTVAPPAPDVIGLTHQQKSEIVNDFAFGGAGGSGSLQINAALRGEIPMTDALRERIVKMDRVFEELDPSTKVQTVYRVVSNNPALRKELVATARKRGLFTDPGYLSTAKTKSAAEDFAFGEDDVLIQIGIPPGAKVLDVDKYLDDDSFSQQEILLNRGSSLRFSSADKMPDGTWRIIASLEKSEPTPLTSGDGDINIKTQSDGYSPGQWQIHTDVEERIREMQANIKKLNPALSDQANREFAEKLVAGTADEGEVIYRNGPHEIIFAGQGNLSPEKQQEFLGYVDHMQSKFPANRELAIRVAPSSEFGWDVGGETTISTGHIRINERVLTQQIWPGMPVSKDVPSALYVLAHEWGHAFPDKADARNTHTHKHAVAAGGMTRYGTHGGDGPEGHAAEGYAEAFAEWSLSNGKTTNKAAQEYALAFRWKERFGS